VRLHKRLSSYAPAFLVISALAIPAGASDRDRSSASTAVARSAIRIENFGQVNATYYRGAQPRDHDYADLAALGVKTIINLTSDDADANERRLVEAAGMKYVQIPMTTHEEPTSAKLTQFLDVVNAAANQPVYVHCVGGRHRTGVMTAIYRMTHDGWSAKQAFAEMKQFKFGADFLHSEFKDFVLGYQAAPAHAAPAVASAETASRK
jgi:uncharacterized protein (TIGR01244 family)